jgi:dUTP pyrophosphatase
MKFLIKPLSSEVKYIYENHSTYHQGDSGLDLFIVKDEVIPPGKTLLLGLGVCCQLTDSDGKYYSYNMYARSSISKTPLIVANGVGLCDSPYVGELKAALHNTSNTYYTVRKGERYVQLARPDLGEISFEIVNELRDTSRGSGGFGSTGK